MGQCGKVHSGYGCLTGQGNGRGGRGARAEGRPAPGYRMIVSPSSKDTGPRVGSAPGSSCQARWNVMSCSPHSSHRRRQGAAGLRLQHRGVRALRHRAARFARPPRRDFAPNEADVILPVTQWAEETGTMTNLEGRVILRNKAISSTPPTAYAATSTSLPALQSLDSPVKFATDPVEIFDELGSCVSKVVRRLQPHHLRPDRQRAWGLLGRGDDSSGSRMPTVGPGSCR